MLEGAKLKMHSVIHDEPMHSPEISVFLRGWIWMTFMGVLLVVAAYVVLWRRESSQRKILGPLDAQGALARRLKEAYLRIVLHALIVTGAIYLLGSGGLGHLLGMLGELRDYLWMCWDVYRRRTTSHCRISGHVLRMRFARPLLIRIDASEDL